MLGGRAEPGRDQQRAELTRYRRLCAPETWSDWAGIRGQIDRLCIGGALRPGRERSVEPCVAGVLAAYA